MSELGEGGMGEVWLAKHRNLERDVAMKFATVAGRPSAELRFRREARHMAKLD